MSRKKNPYARPVWGDRFNEPAVKELRADLPNGSVEIFDSMRQIMQDLDGIHEVCVWRGDAWRWTIEYRTEPSAPPLAILIPRPDDLQLAIPFEDGEVDQLSTDQLKKTVLEGLELAQDPFDTNWGLWSLQFPGMTDQLGGLVQERLSRRRNGRAG